MPQPQGCDAILAAGCRSKRQVVCTALLQVALVVGGLSLQVQASVLRRSPEIVVATPGRLIDHLRNTQVGAGKPRMHRCLAHQPPRAP